MAAIYTNASVAKTQADGAHSLPPRNPVTCIKHLISIDRSAVPTAGTLAVRGKLQGATDYCDVLGTFDLTLTNVPAMLIEGPFADLEFTPTGFDAGKTYTVNIRSWE